MRPRINGDEFLGNSHVAMNWKQEAGWEVCQQSSEMTSTTGQGHRCNVAAIIKTLWGNFDFLFVRTGMVYTKRRKEGKKSFK